MPLVRRFVAPSPYSAAIAFAPAEDAHAVAGIVPFFAIRIRKASLVLGEPGAGNPPHCLTSVIAPRRHRRTSSFVTLI